MILTNYKKLFYPGYWSNSWHWPVLTNIAGGTATPTQKEVLFDAVVSVWNNTSTSADNGYLDVGFSDDPETPDQTTFSGNRQQGLLAATHQMIMSKATGDIINTLSIFRNNGGTNVVVREVAILFYFTSGTPTLMIRKVLDNPVTIAPGEAYSFNYILRFKN